MNYIHPLKDVEFVLQNIINFDGLCTDAGLDEVNMDLAHAILDEAGKMGTEIFAPLNIVGDNHGATLTEQGVQETEGFKAAYQQFAESGWMSLSTAEEFNGQNLPNVLNAAVNEVWHSANLAYALCPLLSQGAMESIAHHASLDLQQQYLPKMATGEWTGTMNITEADAGSDLAAIATRAVPEDEHYRITGQKIFITWGDHQMTNNIVHLVLARLPDAPVGVKGISLFIVPKFLLNEQGEAGERNAVNCLSLEHKLGIHGSPTCVMDFDGAIGYVVGEENKGLSYMFTMMNHARQGVGLQGLAVSERAYQLATQYAKDRLQGTRRDGSRIPIIKHPDVRRMLMLMKSSTEAMRALAFTGAAAIDQARFATSETEKQRHAERVELLTPIIKGWLTEMSVELTSLGVQIHGGMGYIEETGAAQHYRDSRILTIYEGTTGIQALDFIGRKTLLDSGAALLKLLEEMEATAAELRNKEYPDQSVVEGFEQALSDGIEAREWLLANSKNDTDLMGSASVNFLMLFGYLCGGWMMTESALKAKVLLARGEGDTKYLEGKLITTRFFCEHLLPRTQACLSTLKSGSASIMQMPEDQF